MKSKSSDICIDKLTVIQVQGSQRMRRECELLRRKEDAGSQFQEFEMREL
jgi:hypothetical protein